MKSLDEHKKYLLQVNLEMMWSKLAKATTPVRSPSWQCVRALLWYWLWRPDAYKTVEAWKAAGTGMEGLESLKGCQERSLVSKQPQLQQWLQVLDVSGSWGFTGTVAGVELTWSCAMRPCMADWRRGTASAFSEAEDYSDSPMSDIDLKDFNLLCTLLFWLSLCTLILLLCNRKTCSLFSIILQYATAKCRFLKRHWTFKSEIFKDLFLKVRLFYAVIWGGKLRVLL